jgi:hypothetical protein
MLTTFAASVTSEIPALNPMSAVRIGRPAATIEPNMISRMTIATRTPMPSLFGGSLLAKSTTWPPTPTFSSAVFAA